MKKLVLLLFIMLGTALYAQTEAHNFKGTIKNNDADSIKFEKLSGKWKTTVPVDKGGNFSAAIRQGLGQYIMHYKDEHVILFLGNDSDLTITADANNFSETLKYEGKGSDENIFLAELEQGKQSIINKLEQHGDVNEVKKQAEAFFDELHKKVTAGNYNFMFKSFMGMRVLSEKENISTEIDQKIITKKMEGKPSPQFSYENHKGGKTSLADLKGKWVYVDVWATWCGPCRQEIPFLQKIEEEYKKENIVFVSISIDKQEDHEKWDKMVTEKSLGGIQLMADNAWKSDFITVYSIKSIPRFILISPEGNVTKADAPRPSEPELKTLLDSLLN